MKNKSFTAFLLMVVVLSSCIPATTTIPSLTPPTSTLTTVPTATIITAITPTQFPHTQGGMTIEPYQDVRFQNISNLNRNLGESLIETLWFNESTIWSSTDKPIAQNILELGRTPGMGVHELHASGITGKGVTVAIIDQHLVSDNTEFQGKIIKYHDAGTNKPADVGSMHGPSVTSGPLAKFCTELDQACC